MDFKERIIQISLGNKPFSSSEIAREFGVSRQYVSKILSELVKAGVLVREGSTRSSSFINALFVKENKSNLTAVFSKRYINQNLEEHKVLLEIETKFWPLAELSENVRSIVTFAFSEMFNNAIEHSASKYIHVTMTLKSNVLTFVVEDAGVGVFRNIMEKRHLDTETEAIQDLLKGKTTTMPRSHSGEGIFFTSRVADSFALTSFHNSLHVDKNETCICHEIHLKRGTRVTFSIQTDTDAHLNDVFRKYTNQTDESDFGFDKTEIRVKLYTSGGIYISRSQARRILAGLEKFSIVVFDYEGVPVLGQAFADEIYRVFHNTHPTIELINENMSEGVSFMIERAKREAERGR